MYGIQREISYETRKNFDRNDTEIKVSVQKINELYYLIFIVQLTDYWLCPFQSTVLFYLHTFPNGVSTLKCIVIPLTNLFLSSMIHQNVLRETMPEAYGG